MKESEINLIRNLFSIRMMINVGKELLSDDLLIQESDILEIHTKLRNLEKKLEIFLATSTKIIPDVNPNLTSNELKEFTSIDGTSGIDFEDEDEKPQFGGKK